MMPLLFLYVHLLPAFPYFFGLLLLICMISMLEFFSMYNVPGRLYIPAVLAGGLFFYSLSVSPSLLPVVFFLSFTFLLLMRLFAGDSPFGSMNELGPIGIGFLYIPGLLLFQWFLRNDPSGREYIYLLYIAGWLSDGSAYYIGSYFGRNKLCPGISPRKTYEGAAGSIIGGAVGAVLAASIFDIPDITALKAVIIGAVLGTVTIGGDLVESMFKRDAGVKDSGRLIPGHGGLLDKLDGFLISGPVLYLLLRYF